MFKWALRKNPERKNPESRKRENPERNNLECKNLEYDIIQKGQKSRKGKNLERAENMDLKFRNPYFLIQKDTLLIT